MKRELVAPCGINCNLCSWVLDPGKPGRLPVEWQPTGVPLFFQVFMHGMTTALTFNSHNMNNQHDVFLVEKL